MQIPILSGIYADISPDFRTSYPVNMIPVAKTTGISEGYLRPVDGIEEVGNGPGTNRGAILWKDKIYAVMGPNLISIDEAGNIAENLFTVNGTNRVRFTYGFDNLVFQANHNLYLYDGQQPTPFNMVQMKLILILSMHCRFYAMKSTR